MTKTTIDILLASCGSRDLLPTLDPYWEEDNWSELAKTDGRTYGGRLMTVHKWSGETDQDFLTRANRLAQNMEI